MSVEHYENFPVASVLCPPRIRPAVVAIYHFARTADDLADEGTATPEQRLQDLQAFRHDLLASVAGQQTTARWPRVFAQLAIQVRSFALPTEPLLALLDAFEQDVRNPVYASRQALLEYCSRSANPIGRLLMHLYQIDDARSLRQSDAICSALQLINFWQDLSVDGPRGRHYVPQSELQAHQLEQAAISACEDSPAARLLVAELCGWASDLMHQGASLALRVPGRAGWELRLVVQGGLRILEKIELIHHAALLQRPTLHSLDAPLLLWRALRMSAKSPSQPKISL